MDPCQQKDEFRLPSLLYNRGNWTATTNQIWDVLTSLQEWLISSITHSIIPNTIFNIMGNFDLIVRLQRPARKNPSFANGHGLFHADGGLLYLPATSRLPLWVNATLEFVLWPPQKSYTLQCIFQAGHFFVRSDSNVFIQYMYNAALLVYRWARS